MLLGISWHQHVRNDEVRRLTKQPHLSAIVQSRRLSLFGHIARMPDGTSKMDLNSFPRRKLEESTGTSSYYMDENHSAGSEIQRPQYGRRSWPVSEPSTMEIDVYVRRYPLLVVLARNDDDDEHDSYSRTKSQIKLSASLIMLLCHVVSIPVRASVAYDSSVSLCSECL